jgi:hypothetical protein
VCWTVTEKNEGAGDQPDPLAKETDVNITTDGEALDYLTFVSYATQRRLSPHITPAQWGSIFSDWQRFETQYQVTRACAARDTNVLQS